MAKSSTTTAWSPRSRLPQPFPNSIISELLCSRSISPPANICLLDTTAVYHIIYRLEYPDPADHRILRIAGPHFPTTKTSNEVAVLSWLAQNTTIPVPHVTVYDDTTNNILGQEWMLLTAINGMSFDKVEKHLADTGESNDWKDHLAEYMRQMLDVVQQLSTHRWSHVGGLALLPNGGIKPAPMVDENLWTSTETTQSWSSSSRSNNLNVSEPCQTYSSLLISRMARYEDAITHHSELQPLIPYLSLIKAFQDALKTHSIDIDETTFVLAHRDLHFGNVMWDPVDKRITGILDWEFAAVVPAQRWDPPNAFMYDPNQVRTHRGKIERQQLMRTLANDNGVTFWKEVDRGVEKTRRAQRAVNYMRGIIEVLLDEKNKPWEDWMTEAVALMESVCHK